MPWRPLRTAPPIRRFGAAAEGCSDPWAGAGAAQRRVLATKPPLQHMYRAVYDKMLEAARHDLPGGADGVAVELGAGGGFLADLATDVITSDLRPAPGLDLVLDARRLPFADATVGVVFALHVFHHVPDVRLLLGELRRCVVPGGGLVAVEPYWSPLARVLYRYFHPEPFDPGAAAWSFPTDHAFDSNQALSYLVLRRDRARFDAEFPWLEVVEHGPFGGPSYVLTGGIWRRPLLPDTWLVRLWEAEERTAFWRRPLALHHLFVLRRRRGDAC